jgi:hypothetical protein
MLIYPAGKYFSFGSTFGPGITVFTFSDYPEDVTIHEITDVAISFYISAFAGFKINKNIWLRLCAGVDLYAKEYNYIWQDHLLFYSAFFQPYFSFGILRAKTK